MTLTLAEVRERLVQALFEAESLPALRERVVDIARDIADASPDTERMHGAPWDGDCAPSTPRGSALGEEYGV